MPQRKQSARTNSAAGAAEMSRAWHGRAPKHETEVVEQLYERRYLADCAGMEELEILTPKVNIKFGHDVRLSANPQGTQLYFVGGDQSVDLKPFKVDESKDSVILGPVAAITYYTAKHHLEDKTAGPFRHEFGEDGGELPTLRYDVLNELLYLDGGSYVIKLDDYEGQYSAGIRN